MTSSSAVSININHVPATQPTSHSYKRFNWKHPIHTKDSTENTSFIQKSQLSAKQHYVEEQKEEIRRYGLCSQVTSFKETPSFHIKHLYSLKREKYLDLSSQLFLVLRMTSYLAAILTDTLDYWSFIKNHLFLHLEKNKDRSRSTAEEQRLQLCRLLAVLGKQVSPCVTTERQDGTLWWHSPLLSPPK